MSQTSGGLYERFFEEVGKPVDLEAGPLICKDQPDVGRIAEAAAEHGIEIPSPYEGVVERELERLRVGRPPSYSPSGAKDPARCNPRTSDTTLTPWRAQRVQQAASQRKETSLSMRDLQLKANPSNA